MVRGQGERMPNVSIIMGVYNCKNYNLLRKSVESILQQTYKDYEFIICNDGSTNDTLEELKKIAQSDSRIKIISYEKNRGLSHALNECLAVSQGKYIARQDDDDVSKPERLKKQVQFLDENREYAIVGTCADVFDNNGIWGEYTVPEKPQKGDFLWNSPFMHPTTMMRKAELLSGGGGYREAKETRRCEDYDLFMNLYAKGYRGYNIQEKLYYYRIVRDEKNKHRPMKYRVDEMIVRFRGYKNMRMLLRGMPYVFKPVIIGLIPQSILKQIKRSRY